MVVSLNTRNCKSDQLIFDILDSQLSSCSYHCVMHMPTQTHRGECFISEVLKTAFYLSCGAIKVGSRTTCSQRQSSESCPKIKVEKGHRESSVSGWAVTCHLALCLSTESLIISTLTPPQNPP